MNLTAALQSVVAAFKGLTVLDTVTMDPGELQAPGALVQFASCQPLTMGGWEVTAQVVLVVPDSDGGSGPADQFSVILAAATAAGIQPDGPVVGRTVQIPSNPAPLPGMLFPLTVRIDA